MILNLLELFDLLALNAGSTMLVLTVAISVISNSVTNARYRRLLGVLAEKDIQLPLSGDKTLWVLYGEDRFGPADLLEKLI
jgi:hypothetical protein